MPDSPTNATAAPRAGTATDVLTILAVVVVGYAIGPTRIPLHGEETCRALHGIEMARSGDWLVATNQGVPILDRPPLQYWLLALVHRFVHELDPMTLRLTMAITTGATALLVWWYARRFLSRSGALIAGVAFPTTGHVFDLGQRVETDGLFTLCTAAALMVWHAGRADGWRPAVTWSAGCALAALATLTKGAQGAVVFFGVIYLYLLLRGQWREVLRPAHWIGILTFLGVIAIWAIPFFMAEGWEGTRQTWIDPLTMRVSDTGDPLRYLLRLVRFPLSMFGAALPWSLLLCGLAIPTCRQSGQRTRDALLFASVGAVAILGPVWLSEGGLRRHAMPIYAMTAFLAAAVAERAAAAPPRSAARRLWAGYVRTAAIALGLLVAATTVATIFPSLSDRRQFRALTQPWPLLTAVAAAAAAGLPFVWRRAASDRPRQLAQVGTVLALLLAITFNGVIVGARAFEAVRVEPQVAALRDILPPEAVLRSLGAAHHRFVYWYDREIPIVELPATAEDVPPELDYFALTVWGGPTPELPFAWESTATINLDRKQSDSPGVRVVIGRRQR